MTSTMFHLRIRASLTLLGGRHLRVCARTLLPSALLVSLAVPHVVSQGVSTISPDQTEVRKMYQTGLSLVRSGHIDQAISAFKKGLEIAPQDEALLDATGAAYSIRGDLETSQVYFAESLKANPGFISAKQNLGITLFALGHYAEAEDQFKSLQGQTGQSRAVANLFLGMIAEKRSDCNTAVLLMNNAGELLYKYPDAVLSFANCEYQIGNRQRVAQTLEALDLTPGTSPQQYEQAASLYARLGQDQRQLEELNKARSGMDLTSTIERRRAVLLEGSGHLEEAQNLLASLATSQPSVDVLLHLARVAKERGDLAVAMKSLRQASEIDPGREESYLEFSTICADHGNDALALETAEIGLSHVPNSYRLTVQKGAVLEKLGRLNDAEETLTRASSMQKDNSIALLSLAVVQAHSGRPDQAAQTLSNAIRKFPDNYYMYYFRGKLLSQFASKKPGKTDLRDTAVYSLKQSIRLNPEYADSYYQLSELYMPIAPKLAEEALKKCLRLNPNHSSAEYSLARLYLRTGRKTEGLALLSRFKTQQRSEELQQQKQLRIEVAQK